MVFEVCIPNLQERGFYSSRVLSLSYCTFVAPTHKIRKPGLKSRKFPLITRGSWKVRSMASSFLNALVNVLK